MTLKYRLGLCGAMVALAVTSFACVTGRAPVAEGPPAFESILGGNAAQDDGTSLFKGDSAVLTDADIARILSFSFTL